MAKARASTGRPDSGRPPTLRLRTQLSSIDEFVKSFAYFVDETTLFVSSRTTVPVGLRRRFVVTLGDGQEVFCGEGEIVESPARLGGPGSPAGMRLRLLQVDEESQPMHARLLERRRERVARVTEPPFVPASEDDETTRVSEETTGMSEETTRVSEEPRRLAAEIAFAPTVTSRAKTSGPGGPPRIPKPAGVPPIPKPGDPPRVPTVPTAPPSSKPGGQAAMPLARPLGKAGWRSPYDKKPADRANPAARSPGAADGPAELDVDAASSAHAPPDMGDEGPRAEGEATQKGEEASSGEKEGAASALPLPAPVEARPSPVRPAPPADASDEREPAAPAVDPPARRLATPRKKLAGIVAAAAVAVVAAYWGLADRGHASQEREEARAVDDSRAHTSSSGAAAASTAPLADGPDAAVDAPYAAQGDLRDDVPGDALAGEKVEIEAARLSEDDECVAHIDSTPSGASVTIDGLAVGETPLTDLLIECGVPLSVHIARQGFQDHHQRVEASPETPVEMTATLQRLMTQLRVETTPPGATITIDGEVVGSAPIDARVRQAASVHVTATLRGHKVWVQQIRPQRARVTLRAELERIGGP
jgi:hypothetical protein